MDISSGTSSAENNIRQSFFVFLRMDITNNIICDIHSQENKKALADIVFGRTSSAAYIHRTDDLL